MGRDLQVESEVLELEVVAASCLKRTFGNHRREEVADRARQATRKLISPYWHRLLLTSSLRHIAADVKQVSKSEFGHSVSSK